MKIAITFGPQSLAFRRTMDFANLYDDPRGLTGSEMGFVRIGEELAALGHDVTLRTVSDDKEWSGCKVASIDEPPGPCDLAISVNEPDLLRDVPAGAQRLCLFWLNEVSFCRVGFEEHVDLFASPSSAHLDKVLNDPRWREVERTAECPNGKAQYTPDPAKWTIVPLGCDPKQLDPERWREVVPTPGDEAYAYKFTGNATPKVAGKVVYASSPDRGLHWLLQEWPAIKRAVPHATLHIYYRLADWLPTFDTTPYFPPIEPNRAIVTYVRECLRRFAEHGGMGVFIHDSVSRNEIHREMASAECLAYPCQTMSWSEGFSCTILEACAARACPITTDCDALGSVYGETLPLTTGMGSPYWVERWRDNVIRALTDADWRDGVNEKARAFAETKTWRKTAEGLLEAIERVKK